MVGKIDNSLVANLISDNDKKATESGGTEFAETFREALKDINALQQNAATTTELFVRGEITDLHQVMIDAEKARIGLELMLEIRNKLIEGYQEIMRMQM